MDEHRIGLKPIVRRVWAPRRERAEAPHQTGYRWLYVYGFCCPQTGESFFLLLPSVSQALMSVALEAFSKEVNPKGQKRILLVMDQAGWHREEKLSVPSGLELIHLPPYSPQLQPAEELWKFLDEVLANQVIADMEDVENRLVKRSRWLMEQRDLVRRETLFHWWPRLRPPQNTRTS